LELTQGQACKGKSPGKQGVRPGVHSEKTHHIPQLLDGQWLFVMAFFAPAVLVFPVAVVVVVVDLAILVLHAHHPLITVVIVVTFVFPFFSPALGVLITFFIGIPHIIVIPLAGVVVHALLPSFVFLNTVVILIASIFPFHPAVVVSPAKVVPPWLVAFFVPIAELIILAIHPIMVLVITVLIGIAVIFPISPALFVCPALIVPPWLVAVVPLVYTTVFLPRRTAIHVSVVMPYTGRGRFCFNCPPYIILHSFNGDIFGTHYQLVDRVKTESSRNKAKVPVGNRKLIIL